MNCKFRFLFSAKILSVSQLSKVNCRWSGPNLSIISTFLKNIYFLTWCKKILYYSLACVAVNKICACYYNYQLNWISYQILNLKNQIWTYLHKQQLITIHPMIHPLMLVITPELKNHVTITFLISRNFFSKKKEEKISRLFREIERLCFFFRSLSFLEFYHTVTKSWSTAAPASRVKGICTDADGECRIDGWRRLEAKAAASCSV